MPGGCFEVADDADVDACVAAIRDGGDAIWGIAANVSAICCGATDPRLMARRALAVAEATGRPLLYGLHEPEGWPLAEQLALLRPGDVVTYCFRREPTPILEEGRVHPAVREARERGVLFDVGHGMTSFSFPMAEAAIADGFAPDTISTDGYARHVGQTPPHDLPRTMAKLLAAGMRGGRDFRGGDGAVGEDAGVSAGGRAAERGSVRRPHGAGVARGWCAAGGCGWGGEGGWVLGGGADGAWGEGCGWGRTPDDEPGLKSRLRALTRHEVRLRGLCPRKVPQRGREGTGSGH